MSECRGPDFVCIGAQKAGTTWLYENLIKHPDVWMPPIKEIHYFNRVCLNESLLGEWSTPHPHGIKRYAMAIKGFDYQMLRWLFRYYELGMEKDWYLSLFDEQYSHGRTRGDITPAYSTLDERGVRYASQVLDKNLPVLFIMRNPVYRGWSAAKMLLRYKNKSADEVSEEELLRLLDAPHIRLSGRYSETIALWKKYFNNVHILSFDELCTSPELLLSKISRLLQIDDVWDKSTINRRVWSDKAKLAMPEQVFDVLVKYYSSEIDSLRKMEDCECAEIWHDELNEMKSN